jgi:uncharacterized protein YkwD
MAKGILAVLMAAGLGGVCAPTARAAPDTACTGDGLVVTSTNRPQAEAALLCLVNRYRQDNQAPLLHDDTRLSAAALGHSLDMEVAPGYFAHNNPLNPLDTPTSRASLQGYTAGVGENLAANGGSAGAAGVGTPYSLFDTWRNSPEHNKNMLTPGYSASGLGVAAGCWCGGAYFGTLNPGIGAMATQMFGLAPANTSTTAINLNFGPIPGSVAASSGSEAKKCKKKKHKGKKRKRCKKKHRKARK